MRWWPIAIGVLFMLICADVAAAGSSARGEIERQYKQWVAASLKLNVDGVLAVLAPNYTLQTFDGKVIARAMYEKSLRARKAKGQKPALYTTSIRSLQEHGASATVISLETSVTDTPDPLTNKIQKLIHIHQYRDQWVRWNGTWKLSQTVTLLEKTTVARAASLPAL